MRWTRTMAGAWTVALLLSAAALAGSPRHATPAPAPLSAAAKAVRSVADALRAGDPALARTRADAALRRGDLHALQRAHLRLNRALAREQLGQRRAAEADFTAGLRNKALPFEERAGALFDRGVVRDELGNTALALADYNAALKLVPNFPGALNNRANIYRRLGRLSQARHDYQASLAAGNREPQYPDYGLGQIAEAQGNPLAAQHYYEAALSADPHYALAHQRLAALGKTLTEAAYVETSKPAPAAPPSAAPPSPVTRVSYEPDSVPALRPAILGHASHAHRSGQRGAARIQLGAYRAEADAADGWNQIVGQAGALLHGLTPQIVAVDLPGRGRFWRLRAGPVDHGDARALCRQLKAQGLACIPVRG